MAVAVTCVSESEIPAIPPETARKDGDLKTFVAGLMLDNRALRTFAHKADTLLRACVTKEK